MTAAPDIVIPETPFHAIVQNSPTEVAYCFPLAGRFSMPMEHDPHGTIRFCVESMWIIFDYKECWKLREIMMRGPLQAWLGGRQVRRTFTDPSIIATISLALSKIVTRHTTDLLAKLNEKGSSS